MLDRWHFCRVLCTCLLLASCNPSRSPLSAEILNRFNENHRARIDLSGVAGAPWNTVCIFGPYSDNAAAQRVLGFAWDLQANTSVMENEGACALVFVREDRVVAFTEHSRGDGDFSRLSGKCFARNQARFTNRDGFLVSE